ncbi:MAG TPA: hypothetical protein VMM36_04910 [Opitutaceae bacterium]|nr:hypothetical protein [Opitutaceae bacterium]
MEDPNGELRRQRELVAAHLRWLDEQIARSPGQSSPAAIPLVPPPPVSTSKPMPPPHVPVGAIPAPVASGSIPELVLPEIDPGSIRNEVRRGCFIYVIIVTLLLAASIAVAVWIGGE